MSIPLRVLILEDSNNDARRIIEELQRGGYEPTFHECVQTMADFTHALTKGWDIVVSEYPLRHIQVLEALAIVTQQHIDIPFIVVSHDIDEETAVALMRAGAHDCLLKKHIRRLTPTIERELRETAVRCERKRIEQARKESEQRFRKVFQSSPLPIVITQLATSSIIEYNQSFFELVCDSDKTPLITNQSMIELGFWAKLAEWKRFIELLESEYSLHGVELRLMAPSGNVHELLSWMELVEIDGTTCVLCILYDVTERRQAEERIHRQFQRMSALKRVQMSISASLDLHLTFDLLLNYTTALLNVDAAAVLLLNPITQQLDYVASRGFDLHTVQQTSWNIGEGYAGTVARKQRALSINNLQDNTPDGIYQLLQQKGFVAYYGIPLMVKRQVKGVLEIFHHDVLLFEPDWLGFLEAMAGQAAIAINNAELVHSLKRSRDELRQAYDATIEGWVSALDLRDKETEGHSKRVTKLTVALARSMGFNEDELVHVYRGALLHDIGKMGIPDSILHKPGPLSDDEWNIMRKHPEYAYNMLYPISFLRPAIDIPYNHHEKWDGSGYPRGLQGENIPLAARIFTVVDVWDALSFDRPYRLALSQIDVRLLLQQQAGLHFDNTVVEAFLRLLTGNDPDVCAVLLLTH